MRPASRGQHSGVFSELSHRSPRHYYRYSEREVGSGTPAQQESVEQSRRNGTANTFHTSLGVTANFLYSVFDWKHISNIFSWSHSGGHETKGEDNRRERKSNKEEFQDIIHCNELPFNLTLLKNKPSFSKP